MPANVPSGAALANVCKDILQGYAPTKFFSTVLQLGLADPTLFKDDSVRLRVKSVVSQKTRRARNDAAWDFFAREGQVIRA